MKELSQELLKRTSMAFIIIGAILFLFGVAGGIVTNAFTLQISDNFGRVATAVMGFILLGFGVYLAWLEQKQSQVESKDTEQVASARVLLPKSPAQAKPTDNQTAIPVSKVLRKEGENELAKHFAELTELYVVGINLRRMFVGSYDVFQSKLSQGATIKVLLVDPESEVMPILAERSLVHNDPAVMRNAIESALKTLAKLYSSQSGGKGNLEVRVLSFVPSFCLAIIDPERTTGRIWLELYPHQVAPANNPGFWIERKYDDEWYQFFLAQFHILWKLAKPAKVRGTEEAK